MKQRNRLLNYTLSMGLIVLILLFLISLVQISRYVLEDTYSIRDHVSSTRSLLSDIQEVEQSVDDTISDSPDSTNFNNLRYTSHLENDIKRLDYMNTRHKEGIMTFTFNQEIDQLNNTYYLKINSIENLQVGEHILFQRANINDGVIYEIDNNEIKVINFETRETFDLVINDILGKIIVRLDK